jgi:hypothetical protein
MPVVAFSGQSSLLWHLLWNRLFLAMAYAQVADFKAFIPFCGKEEESLRRDQEEIAAG